MPIAALSTLDVAVDVPGARLSVTLSQPGLSVDGLSCFDCAGEMLREDFEEADRRFVGAGVGEWLPGHIEAGFLRR